MKDYKKDYHKIIKDDFPEELTITFGDKKQIYKKRMWNIENEKTGEKIVQGLRYGENPNQQAAMYELVDGDLKLGEIELLHPGKGLVSAVDEEQLIQIGKHPSMNNLTDVDAALNILKYFDDCCVVIVKHNNPSGVAVDSNIKDAYIEANFADRIAAFGGAAVFNRKIDLDTATEISKNYLEVVVAPDYDKAALELLKKKKNLRIIQMKKIENLSEYKNKSVIEVKALIGGGLILQQSATNTINLESDLQIASVTYKDKEYTIQREPTKEEYQDMLFGWKVEQGVKSNSVLFIKNGKTLGIGTGGQDRVGVAQATIDKVYRNYADRLCFEKYAIPLYLLELEVKNGKRNSLEVEEIKKRVEEEKAGLKGSVMISDGFFPFRDTVDLAAKQGIKAIIQPGGSIRDYECIQACNEAGISMVFTGQRAFKH